MNQWSNSRNKMKDHAQRLHQYKDSIGLKNEMLSIFCEEYDDMLECIGIIGKILPCPFPYFEDGDHETAST